MENAMRRNVGIPLPGLKAIREKTYRDGKKLRRAQMAREMGIDAVFLWRLETGRNGAGPVTAEQIAAYLNVSIEALRSAPSHLQNTPA